MSTRIAITGAYGRMGRALAETILSYPDVTLSAAITRAEHSGIKPDCTQFMKQTLDTILTTDTERAIASAEVIIDFTRPEATMDYLDVCLDMHKPLVIGTTGLNETQKAQVIRASNSIPIVMAPNMSIGINLLASLVRTAARALKEGYDIEIIEAHHRHKVDAPSGTALFLAETAAAAVNRNLDNEAVFGRKGHTGPRPISQIGFSVIRGGDIVGDHTVLFAGEGERLELTHKASNRQTFAQGAIRAALFIAHHDAGLYDMQDVIGLR